MTTPKLGRTRKAKALRDEMVNGQPVRCYDIAGHPIDRYTVVYMAQRQGEIYECLGMNGAPFHPQGFCQHSTCTLGKHLGKRIAFAELPLDCQRAVLQDTD